MKDVMLSTRVYSSICASCSLLGYVAKAFLRAVAYMWLQRLGTLTHKSRLHPGYPVKTYESCWQGVALGYAGLCSGHHFRV